MEAGNVAVSTDAKSVMLQEQHALVGTKAAAVTGSRETISPGTITPSAIEVPLPRVQLPQDITLDERELCDLEMLLSGAFAPLRGYLGFQDFNSVVLHSRMSGDNQTVWPLPIVARIPKSCLVVEDMENNKQCSNSGGDCLDENQPQAHSESHEVNLRDSVGTILAKLKVDSCYEPNLDVVCSYLLGSTEATHPYVAYLRQHHSDVLYIGGEVIGVHEIMHFDFADLRKTPREVREHLASRGLKAVVGFQTRNPMHRSHFELSVRALEKVAKETGEKPHLLLTPACGPTQPGDVKYSIRVRCYRKILPYYHERGYDVTLVLLPLAMRMAGPREAVFHAIIRRNYGCSHFIVGRDHAGPSTRKADGSTFYGPYDAQARLEAVRHLIGITPVFGSNMVYAGPQLGYIEESADPPAGGGGCNLPDGATSHLISGTQFRRMLEQRQPVPEWYSFPPVIQELQSFYRRNCERGFCLYFTGLPCAGKTTLTNAVEAALFEREVERREVTVLDADIVRTHLSYGLGYSRADRQANVRRIGFVAATVVRHAGICLVANIAPYAEDRAFNRKLISEAGGGYIEVFVSTPQEVCERRDIKGLYRKARLGVIKQFTSVSDPYEEPEYPELKIDSTDNLGHKVRQILEYLEENRWILADSSPSKPVMSSTTCTGTQT